MPEKLLQGGQQRKAGTLLSAEGGTKALYADASSLA